MTDKMHLTLASALDFIANEIDSTSLDSFLDAGHNECKYVCDTLQITPLQAAVFATILEKSGDDLACTRELVDTLKVSKIRFLGFKKEIDELARKRLVVARQRRQGSMGYRVSQAVIRAVQNNSSIEPEKVEGLSTRGIFNRLHSIFADLSNGITSSEIAIQEIIDLMNYNLSNNFVEAAMRLGINKLDSTDETLIAFYMLHRAVSFSDNEISIEELYRLFDDPMNLNDFLLDSMRCGTSSLQKKGLVEFRFEEGIENKEVFQIPQNIQDTLLSDITMNRTRMNSIPKDELISHADIRVKQMYYNDEEASQVATLIELLSAEKFAQVQDRLREKGHRSGFCSLFYGGPGVGKTETVLQIAKATGRDIFIVDMSKLKSKWIGDSEKNIKQLFKTYKAIVKESELAPILLFNEADAIFGRRIKEEFSADKMNNAMQNIILQEMEMLDGIMIATTNLTDNFDPAFERRFLYKILFKTPEAGVKAKIWKSMVNDLTEDDAARLASEYGFTGGQIENISRKLDVDYILSGRTPDIEQIVTLCKAESIQKQDRARRIGF